MYAELTPQQGEDNPGGGRATRSRARAQQQQQQSEESFEVPGLVNSRRGGPPNKVAQVNERFTLGCIPLPGLLRGRKLL